MSDTRARRIISASRRTDIPAFYGAWFMNRVQAGFCHWINPFNNAVYHVSLRPEDVLGIVFWTRQPKPLLPHLSALAERYRFYFHFTINGYPRYLESNGPPEDAAIESFRVLAHQLRDAMAHGVLWRYDPIVFSDELDAKYHLRQFDRLSAALEGATTRCYFSFVDLYGKTKNGLGKLPGNHRRPTLAEQTELVGRMADLARSRGIALYSCCEEELRRATGVEKAHCIEVGLLRDDRPEKLKPAPTRKGCGCVQSADIGAYHTCTYGCRYCYATSSRELAIKRLGEHDPNDSVLWRPPSLRGVDL